MQVKHGKKASWQLGVADAKLGSAIQEATGVPCVCNELTGELLRGVRLHELRLLRQLLSSVGASVEENLHKSQLSLAHSYSRSKVGLLPTLKKCNAVTQLLGPLPLPSLPFLHNAGPLVRLGCLQLISFRLTIVGFPPHAPAGRARVGGYLGWERVRVHVFVHTLHEEKGDWQLARELAILFLQELSLVVWAAGEVQREPGGQHDHSGHRPA